MLPSITAARSVTRDINPELLLVVNYYLSIGGDSMILVGPVPPTIGVGIHLNDSKKSEKKKQEKVAQGNYVFYLLIFVVLQPYAKECNQKKLFLSSIII